MPMAYMLTKGPVLSVLEVLADATTPDGLALLEATLAGLRDPGRRLTELAGPDAASAQGPGDLVGRLERNWFGRTDAGGTWVDQPAFDPANPSATGYWRNYHGDVEAIVRETLVRAVEVSLGLAAGGAVAQRTRHWPVEAFWMCAHPWVEGWVTWRDHGGGHGQVTVVLATPGDTVNHMATRPLDPPAPHGVTGPVPDPVEATSPGSGTQGMWLVSQSEHRRHRIGGIVKPEGAVVLVVVDVPALLQGLPSQEWVVPTPTTFHEGVGPVVTVEVPGVHGGPVPGIAYDPPT